MRTDSLLSEPRSRLICRRTREAIRGSGLCVQKFSTLVAENYIERVGIDDRIVKFYAPGTTVKSLAETERANGSLVTRFLDGTVKFPADLEEAWIAALPLPFRESLVRELAQRYGLLGARMPEGSITRHVADLADVLRDAGDVAKAMAPMLVDGKIDASDRPYLQASLSSVSQGIDDLVALRAQLLMLAGEAPKGVVRSINS